MSFAAPSYCLVFTQRSLAALLCLEGKMANYAIITGIDIEFQDQGRLVGCAYKNTLEIHKFLCSIGYDTIRMFGSRETKREILDELKWVRGKLKRGDKFLFYYRANST